MNIQQQINHPGLKSHVFNMVTDKIRESITPNLKNMVMSRTTQMEYNLEMGPWAMGFLMEDLEKMTLLDLDTDVIIDDLYTIGDICNLITDRLQKANKADMLRKVSNISLQHYLKKALVVPQK
jgi:hypothetical protein